VDKWGATYSNFLRVFAIRLFIVTNIRNYLETTKFILFR
jgi:hypothetical protein